jgi:hypothetical protein
MTSHNESWLPTTEIAIRSIERHINLDEKGLNSLNVVGSGTHLYIMQFLHITSTVYLGTLAKYHQSQSGYLADSTANVESVALNHASLFPAIPVFRLPTACSNKSII